MGICIKTSLRAASENFGVPYSTVARAAKKLGFTRNGVQTRLTESQLRELACAVINDGKEQLDKLATRIDEHDEACVRAEECAEIKSTQGWRKFFGAAMQEKEINSEDTKEVAVTTMTTKEVADALGTSKVVVLNNAAKCLSYKVIEQGKKTTWTEEEVTVLLDYMKHNKLTINNSQASQLLTDGLQLARTEKTPALKIKRAMQLMQEGYEEELALIRTRAEIAETKCNEQKPKVEFYDAVTASSRTMDVGQVAKLLCVKGFGRNKLMEFLREFAVFDKHNAPYQQYVDKGYFKRVETRINLPNGEVGVGMKTVVFQKGVDFIEKLLVENGYYPATLNDK